MARIFIKTGRLPHFLLIAAAVAISRFNSAFNGFVQDGAVLVVENPFIKGWGNLPDLLTSGYWQAIGKTGGLYRPLTLISFLTEYSIFGLNPAPYHINNLVLHIMCCMLVYLLLEKLMDNSTASLAGSMVFAVHPVLTEIVATVHGRAELLSVLFLLAGLLAFISQPDRAYRRALPPVFLFLGLMSKETAVVLPVLALLYLVVFERDDRGKSVISVAVSLAPFAVALAVYMALRTYAIGDEPLPPPESVPLAASGKYVGFLTMMKALAHYIRLAFFPTDLLIVYDFPRPDSALTAGFLFSLSVLGAFAVFAKRIFNASRAAFFFAAWFLVALLPVSNIIPIGIVMSERAMFLPLVSLCALAGYAFSVSWRLALRKGIAMRAAALALLSILLVSLGVMSLRRSDVWKSQKSYFAQVLNDYKRYAEAYPEHRAMFLENMADPYIELGNKEAAETALKGAAELDTKSFKPHTRLAMLYDDQGLTAPALEEAEKAFSLSGGTDDQALGVIASSYFKTGKGKEAEELLLKAIHLKPDRAEHYINYGLMLKSSGDILGALASMNQAVAVQPTMPDAHYRLGLLLGEIERFGPAATALEKAVSFRPEEPSYRYYLAVAYFGLGDREKALFELEKALTIKPDYPEARALLGRLR